MAKYGLGFVFIVVLMVVFVWREWPDETLRLTMCDVGQGDGLVLTKGYSQVVIDVGPEYGGINSCLGNNIPFWDRTIEAVIVTHSDSDHAGGLSELLNHYKVKRIVTSPGTVNELSDIAKDRSIMITAWKDIQFNWLNGVGVVLWPETSTTDYGDENDNSLVIRWQFGEISLLVTGDIDSDIEQKLMRMNGLQPVTILKIAHHGSKTSTSEPFLNVLQPLQAWISVGKDNRYGHPASGVIELLEEREIKVIRTDLSGSYSYEIKR